MGGEKDALRQARAQSRWAVRTCLVDRKRSLGLGARRIHLDEDGCGECCPAEGGQVPESGDEDKTETRRAKTSRARTDGGRGMGAEVNFDILAELCVTSSWARELRSLMACGE